MPLALPDRADAVLLDLDGVLVDSRRVFVTSLNAALESVGLAPWPAERLVPFLGPPLHGTVAHLLSATGREDRLDEVVDAYRTRARRQAVDESEVFAGMRETLVRLAAEMPLVVATSKVTTLAEPLLEGHGLRRWFHAVAAPEPEAREEAKAVTVGRALAELPEARAPVMVGDRRYDVEGAAAHGVPCIGALWGFGGEDEMRRAGAAALATAPTDLIGLLLGD